MATPSVTDSSTIDLTELDNLTELHQQSELETTHRSRHTKTGFLVQGELLAKYIPTLPSKRPKKSWVWKDEETGVVHGEALTETATGKAFWLCKACYDSPTQRHVVVIGARPTTQAQRHMYKHGYHVDGTRLLKRKADNSQQDIRDFKRVKEQLEVQATSFDRNAWRTRYLHWIVADDISLRRAVSEPHRLLLGFHHPTVQPVLPTSHNTVRSWLMDAYQRNKKAVRRDLSKARSRMTLTFDGWKSDNGIDYLGIIAHYIDESFSHKAVLLGLRNTFGNKSGLEMKTHLLDICKDYKISTRIAYTMSDNATTNDTAIRLLAEQIPLGQPFKARLRCTAHSINLVAKAMLFGVDSDCIAQVIRKHEEDDEDLEDSTTAFEDTIRSTQLDEAAKLKAWRKKGPVGKLHNLVIHARASPNRRQIFMSKQRDATVVGDSNHLFELVSNGGIRWNSTHDMIERAFKLKDALELYQQHFRDDAEAPTEDDCLTNDDWQELKLLLDLLAPLKCQSLIVQSDGTNNHGTLHEVLSTLDLLMTKLEEYKIHQRYQGPTHFKAAIILGWKKLNKYYQLSDRTPAYRAAVMLHPHYKLEWFKKQWGSTHQDWIADAKKVVKQCFAEYETRHADLAVEPEPSHDLNVHEMTEFERYNLIVDDTPLLDELERYLKEPRAPPRVNVLQWWQQNHLHFPILSLMAFDHLAAPASSAAIEREFSLAGNVINGERWHMQDELAEAVQCLKSWYAYRLEEDVLDEVDISD